MKEKKGISLIVLIVIIIVMIIIAGAIIISLQRTNVIERAKYAMEMSEQDGIEEAVIASTSVGTNGETDLQKTYDGAKEILVKEGLVVKGLNTTTKTFEVVGEHGEYIVEILDLGAVVNKKGGNVEPGLDGWQGKYIHAALNKIEEDSSEFYVEFDGKGNATFLSKEYHSNGQLEYESYGTGTYEIVDGECTIDIETIEKDYEEDGTLEEEEIEQLYVVGNIYNLEDVNNKVFVMLDEEEGVVTTFTTNGLNGLEFDGNLIGKTYRYYSDEYQYGEQYTFIDSTHVEEVYISNGEPDYDDTDDEVYYTIPSFIESGEDKFVLESIIMNIERDSNNNIIKMYDIEEPDEVYELVTE